MYLNPSSTRYLGFFVSDAIVDAMTPDANADADAMTCSGRGRDVKFHRVRIPVLNAFLALSDRGKTSVSIKGLTLVEKSAIHFA